MSLINLLPDQSFPAGRPLVMGILNVTPDSFSDGGQYQNLDAALRKVEDMVREGADIVDVGGESTRPGADPVSAEVELTRVIPVVEAIRARFDIPISVDTSTPDVMIESAGKGAALINDVRALRREGALSAAAATGLPVCLMHMQGEPGTMQVAPEYDDLMEEIRVFFSERLNSCIAAGIPRENVLLDPGFGFGKTPQHNLQLINELGTFMDFGCPILVGLSRKSTIGKVVSAHGDDRLTGSLIGAVWAAMRGASVIRVHDVAPTCAALAMAEALATNGEHLT